uniref:Uncharacterized protein n=1 Tax=Siphoviridae sp. ctDIL13 TaxID=2827811 RepID=A0A8S5SYK1_9CAUD|nr:MAG TPA: hypothetical protein [Siphoviridae sp. ctDIL13]
MSHLLNNKNGTMRQRVYAPSQHRADVLLIVSETTFNRLGAFYFTPKKQVN